MFAEAVVLPGTLDVTNVSYRPEEMPDFEVEGAGGMPETYLDMSPHENVDDTLLYAEWDVTIQPIQYNVTVDVYNRNSWSIQFHLLNQVGDTVKNLRHKGSSGQRGLVDIGSWDLSDLSAGDYKLRVHSATAWSAMKLKNIIFNCEGSSGVCGAQGDNIRWELGCDGIFTLSGTGAMKEGDDDNWYSNRMAIKQVTVGSGITNLVSYAFREAENIEEVVFGEGLTSIGNSAFWGCSGIKRVTFPSTLETLEDQAFRSCAYIESIDLPASVKSIGTWAFAYCYLEVGSITSRATTPPTCGDGAFYEISRQTPLYVPAASVAAYKAADQWGEFTNIIALPEPPMFPGDPGTITYKLQLDAAVLDGDPLPDYAPTGAGGYAAGTSVTITAQAIHGYQFVRWSDGNTENPRNIVVNQSTSLTAYYNRSQIEIPVAANAWTFFCLPSVGKPYSEEMFEYVGLTNVKWGTYNGGTRASGKSGWETPESFNAQQGYIIYSTTAGTLRINAYETDLPSGDVSVSIVDYSSSQPENAGWNFLGNPYSQGYSIAGLAAAGIESPITVWNGTGYDTYTPGIDTYILQPFEAFFIQKAEGGADAVTFEPEYVEGYERPIVEGELSGAFSVSATKQIHFSKGNLQYQASTGTWRFAPNQYDMIGEDNANISNSYGGWIDLFGWGTGNNPTNTSKDDNDYSTFVDWGTNAITNGGNEASLWRTLTTDEWVYLFYTRANAATLFGLGSVNGVNGTIILPDNWSLPVGASFTASTTQGLADQSNYYHNDNKNNFSHNTYTIEQWAVMESAGALFMPAAGYRYGTDVGYIDMDGNYWSATPNDSDKALSIGFDSTNLDSHCTYYRSYGRSVRLVR